MSAAGFNAAAEDPKAQATRKLVMAVGRGQAEKIPALVAAGADLRWQSRKLKTSLLGLAAWYGRKEAARELIAAGAPLDLQDKEGRTPLFMCTDIMKNTRAVYEKYDVAVLLLQAGADPNIRTSWKGSPATSPIIWNLDDVVDAMMKRGLDLSARDRKGETLIFNATCFRSIQMLRKFIKAGADVNAQDETGGTPLMKCVEYDLYRQALTLLRAGAQADMPDADGNTALHHAVRASQPKIVRALLKHKAALDIRNAKGESPLDMAQERLAWMKEHLPNVARSETSLARKDRTWEGDAAEILEVLLERREQLLQKAFTEKGASSALKPMTALRLRPKA